MRLADLVATSAAVAATRSRKAKAARLAECLRALLPAERAPAVAWLCGSLRQGRIGVGWAALRDHAAPPATEPTLLVSEVDTAFSAIAEAAGAGSAGKRRECLGALFARATASEQEFLTRVLSGEMRQGGLEGVMAEALAVAAGVPADSVRRAQMLAGNLPEVAEVALREGDAGLQRFSLTLFRPVLPMLATPCEDVGEALERLGEAALEWKLDGARIQLHREGNDVRIYTRGLVDVTAQLPEVVAAALALPARSLILDGEVIALSPDGPPRPFQETMSRFARKVSVPQVAALLPLSPFFFDCLLVDGESLLSRPASERAAALAELAPEGQRVPRLVTADPAQAEAFFESALARGHEGAVAKALAAPYQVGSRGGSWLKLKRAHTLDLVVLAVERGSGRRRGFLSNLHLGARDPVTGGFIMLGKTFKGMTDEMLAWQTERLQSLAVAGEDNGWVVQVRPELVVEIAFDGVQQSSNYPGGFALRFARVKRYRTDKRATDADTIESVRAIFAADRARGGDAEPG
jgi:DNA ligase-1